MASHMLFSHYTCEKGHYSTDRLKLFKPFFSFNIQTHFNRGNVYGSAMEIKLRASRI